MPENSLLTESLPLLTESQPTAEQIPLFSVSIEDSLLTENPRNTSVSSSDGLNQGIYECLSHGRRYYRYICSVGHNIAISRHIPGGCTSNRVAQARAAEVERWIHHGLDPKEIDRRIQSWSKRNQPSQRPSGPTQDGTQTQDK